MISEHEKKIIDKCLDRDKEQPGVLHMNTITEYIIACALEKYVSSESDMNDDFAKFCDNLEELCYYKYVALCLWQNCFSPDKDYILRYVSRETSKDEGDLPF